MARRRRRRAENTPRVEANGSAAGLLATLDRPFAWVEKHTAAAVQFLQPWLSWLLEKVHHYLGIGLRFALGKLGYALGFVPWSIRFAVLLCVMGVSAALLSLYATETVLFAPQYQSKQLAALQAAGLPSTLAALETLSLALALLCLLATITTLIRHRFSLIFMQAATAAYVIVWGWYLSILVNVPALLYDFNHETYDKYMRNEAWMVNVTPWLLLGLVPGLTIFLLVLRRARAFYKHPRATEETVADEVVESLRTNGRDPRYRTSTYWSTFLHLSILIYPVLMKGCGWEKPYAIPQGEGRQVVEVVKVKQKKKPKKKRYILAMNSPIIFTRPDIDDEKVLDDVEEVTEYEYVATSLKANPGTGEGTKGGWPGGMPGRVRFIRLKYRGGDWDQDMGKNADQEFLLKFHELTGFPVADDTEARDIRRLRLFPDGRKPPFVFITGKGGISVSGTDVKTLRWYCLEEGGMIFADNGGGTFDRSFRTLMRRVFPEKKWIDIPNDDILYRHPFQFPNGAPPMWHHSGTRALGIKHNGRWVVFYHQGDLNDAWKKGHSGVSKGLAMQAYKLGVNVMNYAFTRYLEIHAENAE